MRRGMKMCRSSLSSLSSFLDPISVGGKGLGESGASLLEGRGYGPQSLSAIRYLRGQPEEPSYSRTCHHYLLRGNSHCYLVTHVLLLLCMYHIPDKEAPFLLLSLLFSFLHPEAASVSPNPSFPWINLPRETCPMV